MSFSVIIPARNMQGTMKASLEAIFASSAAPGEVLVVDDASTDATREIAAGFPCQIIPVALRSGPMEPRFAGARAARYPILVFVDADVCVRPDTFEKILRNFQDPAVHALTGILSSDKPTGSFFSDYKNFYMRHVFLKQPSESSFLYGSLWAVRREEMIFFRPITQPFGSLVSDSEAGIRFARRDKKVILDHTLEVDHLKKYTMRSLLKNDFVIPFLFSLMFVRYGGFGQIYKKRSFSHASLGQTAAMAGAAGAFIFGLGALVFHSLPLAVAAFIFVSLFYLYWLPFLAGMRGRGVVFQTKAAVLKLADSQVMFLGMMSGFIFSLSGFFKRRGMAFR